METSSITTVHSLTNNPTKAWEEISKNQTYFKPSLEFNDRIIEPNKVRFVCMSDTHSLMRNITFNIPYGDVFIHAGDFTKYGRIDEIIQFNKWLTLLPHRYKIVICGNHELSFDRKFYHHFFYQAPTPNLQLVCMNGGRQYLSNCIYLEDSFIEIYGIKIYGTPWQPEFRGGAFNLKREECLSKWNLIPSDTDILITHTPPLGHGDLTRSGVRAGCVDLLSTVQQRIKPKYHVFGHIHEGYGVSSDGKTTFINASTCDVNHIPRNLPIVFDVPIQGYNI